MKNKIFNKKNLKYLIFFISVIVFIFILINIINKEIMESDIIGYKLVSKYLITDTMTPFMKIVTSFGSAYALIIITILLLIFIKNKKIKLAVAINLISITILNILLKNIIARPRPDEYRIIDETGYSFPSGHSMISMAFYGLLIYIIYKNIKNKKLKIFLISILSLLIVLIGISRIYLGVHYTSDVFGGFLISISYLILYTSIISKYLIKTK